MPNVNSEILRWARQTAGLTLEEAAAKLSIRAAHGKPPTDRLADLEAGDVEPTRPMLVRMAKQYRRPLLTFYVSEPPRRGDRGQDFRTLPDDQSAVDEGLLDALIRGVQARQGLIRAVLEEEDDVVHVTFIGSRSMEDGVAAVVNSIRETVAVDPDEFRSEASPADAFTLLRRAVERAGVYVLLMGDLGSYHTAIDLQTFRGFALADDIAPFIVINDRDSRAAWSFTLLHELAHLFLGQTGVSGQAAELAIERFCNDVASEYLLPHDEMDALGILRLADLDAVQAQQGGPSFYVVKRHRLGTALIESVGRMLRGGDLTTSKAGKVLGVKPQQVQTLVEADRSNQAPPPT